MARARSDPRGQLNWWLKTTKDMIRWASDIWIVLWCFCDYVTYPKYVFDRCIHFRTGRLNSPTFGMKKAELHATWRIPTLQIGEQTSYGWLSVEKMESYASNKRSQTSIGNAENVVGFRLTSFLYQLLKSPLIELRCCERGSTFKAITICLLSRCMGTIRTN